MDDYHLRAGTLDDCEALIHHRVAMFQDMGLEFDAQALAREYGAWLRAHMTDGDYRAWVIEDANRAIVAGGGLSILPWPPGPRYFAGRVGFVYNVYTEPPQRGHGLARRLMEAMHAFCRREGIGALALNASQFG